MFKATNSPAACTKSKVDCGGEHAQLTVVIIQLRGIAKKCVELIHL